MSARPDTSAASAMSTRAPCRSTILPNVKLETPPASSRAVCAHDIVLRDTPRSVPMGTTNRAKLKLAVAWTPRLTTKRAATITQP